MSTHLTQSHDLQFNVAGLLKESVGGARSSNLYVPISELDQLDESFDVTGPLQGSVRLLKTADTVFVRFQGDTTVRLACSRCLDPFDSEIDVVFEEEFHPSVDINTGRIHEDVGDDKALIIDEHHIIDLSEVVRQTIILALPITPLCQNNCAGLCPICGNNRNLVACDCNDTSTDSRWDALSALLETRDDE